MKHFHVNAGVRLPDNFEGDTPEALAFLLYEMMRIHHLEHSKPSVSAPQTSNSTDIIAWLSRTGEDLWYQTNLSFTSDSLTDEYQDKEDEEIENIIMNNKEVQTPKILKKRKP